MVAYQPPFLDPAKARVSCSGYNLGEPCLQKKKKSWLGIVNSNRCFNVIGQLSVDGELTTDQAICKDHISNFYQNLYKECGS